MTIPDDDRGRDLAHAHAWEFLGENVKGDMWICVICGWIEYREPGDAVETEQ